ncbi:proteinase-activated receptor 3-like [Pristis pectinata]|uniref:proteinase-activated receptor 3-like n=1 Tax=Pristis pectinata TaxID=685728 RepID=UPI00223DA22F|nr:proteinase-activated receptor 3-like [Pristis pectinata]
MSSVPIAGGLPGQIMNNSNSVDLSEWAKYQMTSSITTIMSPTLYILVFVIGFPANTLALWIMAAKNKKPSTIFLINLAIADLLLILMLPFKISYHLLGNNWLFGEALCRMMTAFFYGNMYCSILLLTFISIDRYFALVHPFYSRRFRDNGFAVTVCTVIWVMVVLFILPFFLVQQSFHINGLDIITCHDVYLKNREHIYFYYWQAVVVLGFVIPCLITVFCYCNVIRTLLFSKTEYKKAIKVTVLTLFMYLVCFSPNNIILLLHQWIPELHIHYMFFLPLSSFNNCIDPFIYYFISDEWRTKVKAIICFRKAGTKNRTLQSSTTLELTRMLSSRSSSTNICSE